jgi:hypothetical protein
MTPKKDLPLLNFSFINWKKITMFVIACLYIVQVVSWIKEGNYYGSDFLGYWSAGKIANEKGYSAIFDQILLQSVQTQELRELGFLNDTEVLSPSLITGSPYLSFFNLPFQLFAKINMETSYWIWIIINLVIFIGYLYFFTKKTLPENATKISNLNIVVIMILTFPVLQNLAYGQVAILLSICAGEFLRNALNKKPILSGLWLGGMLLKPQTLILIIPVLFLLRNWKTLLGFLYSSAVIFVTSFLLSGKTGMFSLFKTWSGFRASNSILSPGSMINWRMVGENLNSLFNTSLGWVITILGMILMIMAVYFLVKLKSSYGSPLWTITIMGVFSASLTVFWHTHYLTALILVPFLIYASINKLIAEKVTYLWVILTPMVWIGFGLIGVVTQSLLKVNILGYQGMVIGFSGLILNLIIILSSLKFAYTQKNLLTRL